MSQTFAELKDNLTQLYLEDPRSWLIGFSGGKDRRSWLIGFSGGKDSSMVASLIFDVVLSLPPAQRIKPIAVLCTDTRVEIPAIVEMVETTLARMRKCSDANAASCGNSRFGLHDNFEQCVCLLK